MVLGLGIWPIVSILRQLSTAKVTELHWAQKHLLYIS